MQSFITNLLRLIIITGVIVCWAKFHGIDHCWCDFMIGWHFQAKDKNLNLVQFIGGGARLMAEFIGIIAVVATIVWTLFKKDKYPEDNSCLANVISRTFFGGK